MTALGRLRMNEAQLTDVIVDAARLYGWKVAHFRPAQTARGWRTAMQGDTGFPDLVLARDGEVIMAELKVGRAKRRPDQMAWAEAIGPDLYQLWTDRDLDAIMRRLRTRRPSAWDDPAAHSQPG